MNERTNEQTRYVIGLIRARSQRTVTKDGISKCPVYHYHYQSVDFFCWKQRSDSVTFSSAWTCHLVDTTFIFIYNDLMMI